MTHAELAGTTHVNATFPALPSNCLNRDHVLDQLEDIFATGYDTILVDGPEGSGKTSLLALFARRHAMTSISAFVRASSRFGHDPDIIQSELSNQIHWIVFGTQLPHDASVDAVRYRDLLGRLQRHIRARNIVCYFILDGLDELPDTTSHVAPILIDELPFGYYNCRFIISPGRFAPLILQRKGLQVKEYWPPNLSGPEIVDFFAPQELTRDDLSDLHRIARGVPGKLASVRRLLQRGKSLTALVQGDNSQDIFSTEIRQIDDLADDDRLMVTIIAVDPVSRTVGELAAITTRDVGDLTERLTRLTFLELNPTNHQVTFVSEVLRTLARRRLSSLERRAHEQILTFVLADPESDRAIAEAPTYLERTGRTEQLLDFLTAERFERLLERDQSLTLIKERGDKCLAAALQLSRIDHGIRMALQQAALRSALSSYAWRDELDALLAIDDIDKALTLAQSLFLKEDRLHALAIYTRYSKQRGRSLTPEIIEQIQALVADIDFAKLGSRAGDIASDLMFAMPSVAIRIAEQTSWDAPTERDWQLMRIATEGGDELDLDEKALTTLRSRIEDPLLRLLSHRRAHLVGANSAAEVLADAAALEKPEDRLFLLKAWCQTHPRATDALSVVAAALDLFVRITEYRPTLADLRRIAAPLAFVTPDRRLADVLARLLVQAETLEALGPSEEYVRLQLLIARARRVFDLTGALDATRHAYLYITYIKEKSTRAACLAWLARALPDVDPNHMLDERDDLHTVVPAEVQTLVQEILRDTAEHTVILSPVVEALSKHHLAMALDFLPLINTAKRRDEALWGALDAALHGATAIASIGTIVDSLQLFHDTAERDAMAFHILETIATSPDDFTPALDAIERLYHHAQSLRDATAGAESMAHAHVALRRFGGCPSLVDDSLERAEMCLRQIDDPWSRVDCSFQAATVIAPHAPDAARRFIGAALESRTELSFDSTARAAPYIYALNIALRLLSGLLFTRSDTQDDRARLLNLI